MIAFPPYWAINKNAVFIGKARVAPGEDGLPRTGDFALAPGRDDLWFIQQRFCSGREGADQSDREIGDDSEQILILVERRGTLRSFSTSRQIANSNCVGTSQAVWRLPNWTRMRGAGPIMIG